MVTPHAERDRIFNIQYHHRDHRRDPLVKTTTIISSATASAPSSEESSTSSSQSTEEELQSMVVGKFYKAGVKRSILDHDGAGYQ